MYKYSLYILLGFVLNSISSYNCFSQTTSNFEMSYFEDSLSTHSLESVKQESFIPVPNNVVNLGITKSTLWVRITLNTKVLKHKAVLEVKTPLKDSITLFYQLKNKEKIKETLGIMIPYSKNKLNHYLPAFEIPTDNLYTPVVYLKVKSRYSMFVPISVQNKEPFYKERVSSYFIGGLLIGGLFLMGIYNLFLYFSTKDFSYILYVLALFSAILSQGYLFGLLIPYLSPELPEFSFRFPIVIMSITGIFSSLFAIQFLELRKRSLFFYFLLLIAVSLLTFNIILELLKFDYLSRKINILLIIGTSLIIFSSAVYSLIKKNKIAIYFTIAWTFYLFGMIVFALKSIGLLPHNYFTDHFMHVGTFMEVLLLSFALGHKYSLIRIEKERLEHQTRKELEQLVKIQTTELEASLTEKEVLLKEIHHRVKNNLQIIISLLDLQVASIEDPKNKEVLMQSKSRVYSMSLIHQKLYQSDNLAQVNMKNYIEELFTYVQNSYSDSTQKTSYTLQIENKELSLTKAVPLGLIVNELLTNSFKYGFQTAKNNEIKVTLSISKTTLILEIADSGKGFDDSKSMVGVKKSLGLFLIKSLTKQLRGSINRFYDHHLFVTQITVPLEKNEK